MLVENKFVYISLPRSASTSFMIACGKNGLKLNHFNEMVDTIYNTMDWKQDNEKIADSLAHLHQPITTWKDKWKDYEIISVNRNRHQRFVSLLEHVVDELYRIGETKIGENLQNITIDKLFFYKGENLFDYANVLKLVKDFAKILNVYNCVKNKNTIGYILNMLKILINPIFYYHNFDPKIIWFDFNELHKLEEWVSNKLNIDFKLEKINSSKKYKLNFKIDDKFIEMYNSTYDLYDIPKTKKTLF
jgi:hypothetical protein